MTNAVVMPYVLAFNRAAIDEKMRALAHYLDLPEPSFESVLDWVLRLREDIGIPHTLEEIGVARAHAGKLAPMALQDPSSPTNPVPLSVEALEELYLNCIEGRLPAPGAS